MEVLLFGVSFIRGSRYSIANIENIRILMYLQYVVTAAISLDVPTNKIIKDGHVYSQNQYT